MQKKLLIKILTIALISVVLLIPINMISGKIHERAMFKDEARESIASSWTRQQTLLGPILAIPYKQTIIYKDWDNRSETYVEKSDTKQFLSFLAPDVLNINGKVKDEIRRRGIYEIPVYTADLHLSGEYKIDKISQHLESLKTLNGVITFGEPFVIVSMTDPRGINQIPEINWVGENYRFLPGSNVLSIPQGVHTFLPHFEDIPEEDISFELQFSLRGIESISLIPGGESTSIQLDSNWPHPKFIGQYLPASYEVSDQGYSAQWQVSSFATNLNENLQKCAVGNCEKLMNTQFGVEHIEAVDVYLQSERSVKYAFLFVILTFLTFFLLEVKNGLSIHPIQYTLVGVAIALFYLLLFALSEHLLFMLAYGIASVFCVAIIGFYVAKVIGGPKQASMFSGALWLLYAVLYVIVSAEDYALLMGAILTFCLLSLLMIVTRSVDWFSVMNELESLRKESVTDVKKQL